MIIEKITEIQNIFNDIADAIKIKLGIEDWEEICIGPRDYARKILEIKTCDHSDDPPVEDPPIDNPPVIDPVDPEIEMDIDGNIEFDFNENLEHVITISYTNCDVVNDPQVLSISRNVSWLRIEDTKVDETGKIYTYTIVADPNEGEERRAQIVFSCIKGVVESSASIIVIQKECVQESAIILNDNAFEVDADTTGLLVSVEYLNIKTINAVGGLESWIQMTHSDNTSNKIIKRNYVFTLQKNETYSDRSAIIVFSGIGIDGKSREEMCIIKQLAKELPDAPIITPTISFNPTSCNINGDQQDIEIVVTYKNGILEQVLDPIVSPWVTLKSTSIDDDSKYKYIFSVSENIETFRSGTIIFRIKHNSEIIQSTTFVVNQDVKEVIVPVVPKVTFNPASGPTIDYHSQDVTFNIICENVSTFSITTPTWAIYETSFVASNETKVILRVEENSKDDDRDGIIKISARYGEEKNSFYWTFTQKGKPAELDPEQPGEENLPMYYGYIPYDSSIEPATWKSEGFNLITEDWILDGVTNGNITKVDAGSMDKTSFGVVPKRSLLLIAVPSDSGLAGKMDNGIGGKVAFSVSPYSNGENVIDIEGHPFKLYGEYTSINYPEDSTFFYID